MKSRFTKTLTAAAIALAPFLISGCDFDRDRSSSDGNNLQASLFLNFLAQTVSPTPASTTTIGMYCGSTASLTGAAGGYSTLRTLCQASCGTTTAHVCTPHEMIMTQHFGDTSALGTTHWVAAGAFEENAGANENDCTNWSSSNAAIRGATYSNTAPGHITCSNANPFACCDFYQISQ